MNNTYLLPPCAHTIRRTVTFSNDIRGEERPPDGWHHRAREALEETMQNSARGLSIADHAERVWYFDSLDFIAFPPLTLPLSHFAVERAFSFLCANNRAGRADNTVNDRCDYRAYYRCDNK
jgi:hypothetical protein